MGHQRAHRAHICRSVVLPAPTAGFEGYPWPDEPMTLERNREDLGRHAEDCAGRRGFAYTVLSDPGGDVVGCVYIYPSPLHGVRLRTPLNRVPGAGGVTRAGRSPNYQRSRR